MPDVRCKTACREGVAACSRIAICRAKVQRVLERDSRQSPELRQVWLLDHDGHIARQPEDLEDRKVCLQVVQCEKSILQLNGALVHLREPEVNELAPRGFLRAEPLWAGPSRDANVPSCVPPQHVGASEHLAILVNLRAEDRVRPVGLHVHPDMNPAATRERCDKNAAVLPVELRDGKEGETVVRNVLQLLRGVRIQDRVRVLHALVLLLHCEVDIGIDFGVPPSPCDEVHVQRSDLGLLGLPAQAEGPVLEVQPDGTGASVPHALADDLRGVVEGHAAEPLWVRRRGILDHDRDVSRDGDGGQHHEELRPLAVRGPVAQHQQEVVEGGGSPVRRLQLHARQRVHHVGGQGAVG
mmetsp:Transcript_79151/g.223808  ORF Transcript_79151/g.223808 Transcript_79151/m.223808 type:complete len:354 (-) Transcript_79151:630-1691(-)